MNEDIHALFAALHPYQAELLQMQNLLLHLSIEEGQTELVATAVQELLTLCASVEDVGAPALLTGLRSLAAGLQSGGDVCLVAAGGFSLLEALVELVQGQNGQMLRDWLETQAQPAEPPVQDCNTEGASEAAASPGLEDEPGDSGSANIQAPSLRAQVLEDGSCRDLVRIYLDTSQTGRTCACRQ